MIPISANNLETVVSGFRPEDGGVIPGSPRTETGGTDDRSVLSEAVLSTTASWEIPGEVSRELFCAGDFLLSPPGDPSLLRESALHVESGRCLVMAGMTRCRCSGVEVVDPSVTSALPGLSVDPTEDIERATDDRLLMGSSLMASALMEGSKSDDIFRSL